MEWARTKARADRWSEEIALLLEEMRRASVYLGVISMQWKDRAEVRISTGSLSLAICDGLRAYGMQQSHLFRQFQESFNKSWEPAKAKLQERLWTPETETVDALTEGLADKPKLDEDEYEDQDLVESDDNSDAGV